MAEKSCRPAFSLPFHHLIIARQVDFSDEVPDQFNLLPAVAAGLIRRMDDNLLYKLIDDGGCQFPDAHILPNNGCKAGEIGLILFKGFYCFSPRLYLLHQFFLFRLIVGGELQVWPNFRKIYVSGLLPERRFLLVGSFPNHCFLIRQ